MEYQHQNEVMIRMISLFDAMSTIWKKVTFLL
jgi:hypothetical protein